MSATDSVFPKTLFGEDPDKLSHMSIQEAFRALAGGKFPILHISEEYSLDCDEAEADAESLILDSYEVRIDTGKMSAENISEDCLRYIKDVLETVYTQACRMVEKGRPVSVEYSTSRKYSFGDTASWWKKLSPETTEGRVVWKVTGKVRQ